MRSFVMFLSLDSLDPFMKPLEMLKSMIKKHGTIQVVELKDRETFEKLYCIVTEKAEYPVDDAKKS